MIQVLINGAVLGAVYALIALGLTMVFSIMRVVNFAHGQMYMLGAFLVYYLYGEYGLPFYCALRAVAQDKEAARLQGVDVKATTTLGFAIGAALAGLAGGLLVTVYGVNSGVGMNISTKAFIMIMIGGAGITSGAIVGGVLLGFAEAIGYDLLPGSVTYLLIFISMIVFLVFQPNGPFGQPWVRS